MRSILANDIENVKRFRDVAREYVECKRRVLKEKQLPGYERDHLGYLAETALKAQEEPAKLWVDVSAVFDRTTHKSANEFFKISQDSGFVDWCLAAYAGFSVSLEEFYKSTRKSLLVDLCLSTHADVDRGLCDWIDTAQERLAWPDCLWELERFVLTPEDMGGATTDQKELCEEILRNRGCLSKRGAWMIFGRAVVANAAVSLERGTIDPGFLDNLRKIVKRVNVRARDNSFGFSIKNSKQGYRALDIKATAWTSG